MTTLKSQSHALLNELKTFLSNNQTKEVFFSAKFCFYEKDTKEDLFDKLMSGIDAMKASFVNDDSVKALIVQDVIKKDERGINDKASKS